MKKITLIMIMVVGFLTAESQTIADYEEYFSHDNVQVINSTNKTFDVIVLNEALRYYKFTDTISSLIVGTQFTIMLALDYVSKEGYNVFRLQNKKFINIHDYAKGYIEYVVLYPNRRAFYVSMDDFSQSFFIYSAK